MALNKLKTIAPKSRLAIELQKIATLKQEMKVAFLQKVNELADFVESFSIVEIRQTVGEIPAQTLGKLQIHLSALPTAPASIVSKTKGTGGQAMSIKKRWALARELHSHPSP